MSGHLNDEMFLCEGVVQIIEQQALAQYFSHLKNSSGSRLASVAEERLTCRVRFLQPSLRSARQPTSPLTQYPLGKRL
jgi:hypothetical protein